MNRNYDAVVNKQYMLDAKDIPEDLKELNIPFDAPPNDSRRFLRKKAAYAAASLFSHAWKEGLALYGISGYRSYFRQQEIYENSLKTKGPAHTQKYIAPPGSSEHQTGLALDVSCPALRFELEEEFEHTKEGIWLARYAPIYGFILRYPKNREAVTGFAYEPWHIRYVTEPLAFYLSKTNTTLEEYHGLTAPTDVREN